MLPMRLSISRKMKRMSDAVLVALIALAGQIIIAIVSNSGLISKLDKQSEVADTKIKGEIAVIQTEVQTLREEVQKHNQVVSRTYELEKQVARHDEQIKTLFKS